VLKIILEKLSQTKLVAVSKTVGQEKIYAAIAAGIKIFGENYLKEAEEKWPEIRAKFPEIELHLIGHLQSNKAAQAVALFDCIETLDSKKLALVLQREITKQQKNPEIFIQVNIGEEPQKHGIAPQEVKEFVKFCRKDLALNVTGLMCIPPTGELASPYFALLNKLAKECGLKNLSMGMSADWKEAVALGATHVRLGTAIFGSRVVWQVVLCAYRARP